MFHAGIVPLGLATVGILDADTSFDLFVVAPRRIMGLAAGNRRALTTIQGTIQTIFQGITRIVATALRNTVQRTL